MIPGIGQELRGEGREKSCDGGREKGLRRREGERLRRREGTFVTSAVRRGGMDQNTAMKLGL